MNKRSQADLQSCRAAGLLRIVRVDTSKRLDRAIFWALRRPTLWVTADSAYALRSRLVWSRMPGSPIRYRLSPLGLLHGLTGLTLLDMSPDK